MRLIYTLLLYLATPYLIARLYWKSRSLASYRTRMRERFALNTFDSVKVDIWLHAVSYGEVVAAGPLIEKFLNERFRVMITTMTPTGSERVQKQFGSRVVHQYVPYDLPVALNRFFKNSQPKIGIIMETELWPNLIVSAAKRKIPLILANARISDVAYKKYLPFRWFFKPLLRKFTCIMAQSAYDKERFLALGADPENVKAAGNMKFDIKGRVLPPEAVLKVKEAWGQERVVLIAASTHEGEELQLLSVASKLKENIPSFLLLIAPRHPERFQSVYALCQEKGLKVGRRSDLSSVTPQTEVIVLDSMGELMAFYQTSDYAFVGGSLVPIGGHNLLEPIAVDVPVFTGIHTENSKSITEALIEAEALQISSSIDHFAQQLIRMHQTPNMRQQQVRNARRVLEESKGVVEQHFKLTMSLLEAPRPIARKERSGLRDF